MRVIETVRALCPRATANYLSAIEQGGALFAQHGVTTPQRMAQFLAQAALETGGFTIERESGNYRAERIEQIFGVGHHSARVTHAEARQLAGDGPALFERVYGLGNPHKARELGNTQPGDGWRYRGNGVLQTTGRGNHRRMGQKCGVDFENFPELVTTAEHALKPALAEWTEGNLNAAADRGDIEAITRRINGGLNGFAERKAWFAKFMPMLSGAAAAPEAEWPPAKVKVLQRVLAAAGFDPGPDDGIVGVRTVKAFQRSRGLLDDGIVGPKTRPMLQAALG